MLSVVRLIGIGTSCPRTWAQHAMLVRPPFRELRQIIDDLRRCSCGRCAARTCGRGCRPRSARHRHCRRRADGGRSAARARRAGLPGARQERSRRSRHRRSDNRSGAFPLQQEARSFRGHQQRRASCRRVVRGARRSARHPRLGRVPARCRQQQIGFGQPAAFGCRDSFERCVAAATNSSGSRGDLDALELPVVAHHVPDRASTPPACRPPDIPASWSAR